MGLSVFVIMKSMMRLKDVVSKIVVDAIGFCVFFQFYGKKGCAKNEASIVRFIRFRAFDTLKNSRVKSLTVCD